MSGLDSLIQQFAATGVDDTASGTEVSFVGLALTLDTEKDADGIVEAINKCPMMTTLRLEGNTVGVPAAKAIAKALEKRPTLQYAMWKDMFTRRDKDEIPKALAHLSAGMMTAAARLVVLDLSDNAFGPRGLVGLQQLLESPCCFTLRELHLNNNGLGISGAKMLASSLCKCVDNSVKAKTPLGLKVFVCGRNRLENEGAKVISQFFRKLGTLESVAMPQNGICHEGIGHLASAFEHNSLLRSINLEDNSITEAGAKHLARCLSCLPELVVLNLGDCLLRTDGAMEICRVLEKSCSKLQELNLGFNEIEAVGGMVACRAVIPKKGMRSLVLNGNQFGESGCQELYDLMEEVDQRSILGSLSEDEGEDDDNNNDDDYEDETDEEGGESGSVSSDSDCVHEEKSLTPSHKSPMSRTTVQEFCKSPSAMGLQHLYAEKEDFSAVLGTNPSLKDLIDLFVKICSVVNIDNLETVKPAACHYADLLIQRAYAVANDAVAFNNELFVAISLIKGEGLKYKKLANVTGVFFVLEHVVRQPFFHASTRDQLQFILTQPMTHATSDSKASHVLLQALYQF